MRKDTTGYTHVHRYGSIYYTPAQDEMAIEDEIFQSDNKMKTFMTQRPNNRTVTADRRKVSKVLLFL